MERCLNLTMLPQPDDTACGPTCLQAIYAFWRQQLSVEEIIEDVHYLPTGGTLAVFLANHALERGYRTDLFTFNLQLFDPSWFHPRVPDLAERLQRQAAAKPRNRLRAATRGYLRFLELGGHLHYEDLTANLLQTLLRKGVPLLAGLSSTYLYRAVRETDGGRTDDVLGEPEGHFVVIHGYDAAQRTVRVADPYHRNPINDEMYYTVGMDRLLGAILLGVLTHDANFLVIQPGPQRSS